MVKLIRLTIGFGAIGYALYSGNTWFYLGVIPLAMAFTSWCPISKALGGCKDGACADGSCCTPSTPQKSPSIVTTTKIQAKKENISTFATTPQELPDVQEGVTTILILGTGCAKCIALKKAVDEAVATKEGNYTVRKVENIEKIMSYGVISTPGLVVDGKVISSGKAYTKTEVEALLNL